MFTTAGIRDLAWLGLPTEQRECFSQWVTLGAEGWPIHPVFSIG